MIRGLVFDLDDTITEERDYVRSGFRHVARLVGRSVDERQALATWLWNAFEDGVRGDTFDRLLEAFPGLTTRVSVRELTDMYRTHPPDIVPASGMPATFDDLKGLGVRLGVLTDGPTESQSRKVDALGLREWFDPIVMTESMGAGFAKPSVRGFEVIQRNWALAAHELGYVADNPEKDFAGPRQLGWLTIRLRLPGQLRFDLEPIDDANRPDVEIHEPGALLALISAG